MIWRILIIAALVTIVVGGIVWISGGSQMLTKDKEEVVTMTADPLFGDSTRNVTYVDKFQLGLLPPSDSPADVPMSYAFILGTSVAVILFSVFMSRRSRKATIR